MCVENTGNPAVRSSSSPWMTAGLLCHMVTSTPSMRMDGRIFLTPSICAISSRIPERAKASIFTGMITSSAAAIAATLAAVNDGGQSITQYP